MSDCDEDGCQNYAIPGHQYCSWHESNPRQVTDTTTPGQGAIVPLWDANRMGQECKRNAERRAAMGRNIPMNVIVKFAYEATLATMRDEYEHALYDLRTDVAIREKHVAKLEAQLANARKWLPDSALEDEDE